MKLYNREDFLALPAGTIYSRVDEHRLMQGLYRKDSGPELKHDFVEQDLIGEYEWPEGIDDSVEALMSQIKLRDSYQDFRTDLTASYRDGFYESDFKAVVWDKEDIRKLFYALKLAYDSL